VRKASLAVLGCLVLATACGGASPAAARQVASLQITSGYPLHAVTLTPKLARVPAGSEFSIIVDTTDGPMKWELTTAGLPAIVETKGSTPAGSCGSPPRAGCALPQRYTFLAKAQGTTTMVWTEYALACPGQPASGCRAVIQPIQVTVT
jgi:hypothetical protein